MTHRAPLMKHLGVGAQTLVRYAANKVTLKGSNV